MSITERTSLMKLHALTNPDSQLQGKMRFFADYFLFANEFLGKLPGLPFDNPLSLIDKILFVLENRGAHCYQSIELYLQRLMLFEQDYLSKTVESYAQLKSILISPWRDCSESKGKKKWLVINSAQIIQDAVIMRDELQQQMFDTMFDWLSSYLQCSHPLEQHTDDIVFATQIIVSHFRLNGVTKEEVSEYIDRILSDNKNNFPLPAQIFESNRSEQFNDHCEEFFANCNFTKQFEGLKNVNNRRKGFFLFPIIDVVLDEKIAASFFVLFDQVTFISPLHSKLQAVQKSCKQKGDDTADQRYYDVFFGKNRVLACVELFYEKRDSAAKRGRDVVAAELAQFNAYIDHGQADLLTGKHYLFTEDFTESSWHISTQLTPSRLACIDDEVMSDLMANPFQRLAKARSKAEYQITRNERTFIRAYQDEQVSAYWIYLEHLFWLKQHDGKKVKDLFKRLSMREKAEQIANFEFYTGHLFNPYDRRSQESLTGLSDTDEDMIYRAVVEDQRYPFNWHPYREKILNPFLKVTIAYLEQLQTNRALETWEQYSEDIIQELFDYRNAEMHSGVINDYSRIKLAAVLPGIVSRIRNLIVKTAEALPDLNFEQVLGNILDSK